MLYEDNIGDVLQWAKQKQPIELMQFTGLLDKNKKEIYEGDVVNYEIKLPKEILYKKGIVKWDEDWASFAIYDKINDNFAQESDWVKIYNSIEVIGNIYDNPELLKGAV